MNEWHKRFSIAGKRALVTGASKGIGAEIVDVFLDAGVDVAAVARDPADLEARAEQAAAAGGTLVPIAADLAGTQGPDDAAQAALARFGTVDILVNCAGVAHVAPISELSVEAWDETMNVNLRAPFLIARALAPAMIAQRRGKIVNISSQTGVVALEDHAAYASSKGALNALTKSMTAEWARYNIQINAICPTVVMTPMGRRVWSPPEKSGPMLARTPAGRFGEPVEVADCALYLASPAADLVNGTTIMLEGGYTAL